MIYSLEEDLEIAIKAAKQAGELIAKYFSGPLDIREKSPNNPVTDADIAADKLLQKILLEARPQYGWLSEEEIDTGTRFERKYSWFVDPIDGTRAFIQKKPHFTVSIALIDEHEAIVGVIYNPLTDELFYASKNNGAYKNNIQIFGSNTKILEESKALGSPHMYKSKEWPKPWPKMHIETRNSIAYRMALVASGEFDLAIATTKKNDWDIAAGIIILKEAHAKVTDHMGEDFILNGKSIEQKSLIASCNGLFDDILSRMKHIE